NFLGRPPRALVRPARRRQAHGHALARRALHGRERRGDLGERRAHRRQQWQGVAFMIKRSALLIAFCAFTFSAGAQQFPARPIRHVATGRRVVEGNEKSASRTLQALIGAAKSSQGKLNYGSAGPGNTSHLAVELFKTTVGIDAAHIPYKGSGPSIIGLLGGET